MSKFISAASTAHTLSLTSMEEASRFGQRTADVDHMFLALVVNEQVAGQVLRSLGITLDAAREAVAAQHAEQLASLGIASEPPTPGRIVFHETGGYRWGDRSLEIIKKAGEGENRGDAAAVLRELVVEPSGMIEAVLHRLGTTPGAVTAGLDEVERYPTHAPQRTVEPGGLSGASESFAPAATERVWELLADPARMPEWEPTVGSVDAAPDAPRAGDSWRAHARTRRSDGKPIPVKAEFVSQRIELVARDECRLIEWCFTYPDTPAANQKRLRIELEPAAGGTRLRLALVWERHPERRRRPFLALLMRPLARFSLWMQLSQLGNGIGRAFR